MCERVRIGRVRERVRRGAAAATVRAVRRQCAGSAAATGDSSRAKGSCCAGVLGECDAHLVKESQLSCEVDWIRFDSARKKKLSRSTRMRHK